MSTEKSYASNEMTIAFFSNFLSEHQIPFCDAMYRCTDGKFIFIATEPMDSERLLMGFTEANNTRSYICRTYESEEKYKEALRIGENADVVIIGSAPEEFIAERLKQNKLTFRYCERFFKEGLWRLLDPRVLYWRYRNDFCYRNRNLHMLCASAYTAQDCRLIFSYPGKTYKWGYFPEVKRYENFETLRSKGGQAVSILWTGRFISWKHPETVIDMARKLKQAGYHFKLDMIGSGVLDAKLRKQIAANDLNDKIRLLGVMSPEKVREHMEAADIFLFTSDRNEGWGVVLNESMNSGCAVVANRAIGSVPFLLEDGKNGLIYDTHGNQSLYDQVKCLMDDAELRTRLQRNAYETMLATWNAEAAVERLLDLFANIRSGKETTYVNGPCSKA